MSKFVQDLPEPVPLDYDMYVIPKHTREKELPPIILCHGFLCSRKMYEDIAIDLSTKTERTVYNIDLRGHGSSPRGPTSKLEDFFPDLLQFLKDRSMKKASLVCHSFSALTAILVGLERPDLVEKIVMIDHPPDCSYGREVALSHARGHVKFQNKLLESLNPNWGLEDARQSILNKPARSATVRKFLENAADNLLKEHGSFKWKTDIDHLLQVVENCPAFFIQPKDAVYHGEILVIRAADSDVVPDRSIEYSSKLNPKLQVITYEKGGHLLMFEQRDRFIEDVARFLNTSPKQ